VSGAEELTRTAEELGGPFGGDRFARAVIWRPLLYLGRDEEALSQAAELAWNEAAMGEGVRTGILTRTYLGKTAEAGDDLHPLLAEPRLAFEDETFPTFALVEFLEAAVLVAGGDLCSALADRLASAAHLSTVWGGANLTCPRAIWAQRRRCWARPTRPAAIITMRRSRRWRTWNLPSESSKT